MTGFSQAVEETIRRFGVDLGVDAQPDSEGAYTFVFSHWGALSLLCSENGDVIITLSRLQLRPDQARERRLLELAGRGPAGQPFLHCGLAPDGSFVCALVQEQQLFDLVTLGAALERLVQALDSID